jgi:hypothetical protein
MIGLLARAILHVVAVACLALAFSIVLDYVTEQAPVEYRPDYALMTDCLYRRDFVNSFTMSVTEIEHSLEFCYGQATAAQR